MDNVELLQIDFISAKSIMKLSDKVRPLEYPAGLDDMLGVSHMIETIFIESSLSNCKEFEKIKACQIEFSKNLMDTNSNQQKAFYCMKELIMDLSNNLIVIFGRN